MLLRAGSAEFRFLASAAHRRSSQAVSATRRSIASNSAVDAVEQVPFNVTPVDICQSLLENIHDFSGHGPWWAAIVTTTLLLRSALTFPLALYQQRNMAKMAAVRPMARAWADVIKEETRRDCRRRRASYDQFKLEFAGKYQKKLSKLYEENDVRPLFNLLLPLAQIPLWITMSLTLRRMADISTAHVWPNLYLDSFATESVLWASTLVSNDPTWIGPVTVGVLNLANFELSAFSAAPPSPRQKLVKYVYRGACVLMVPVAKTMPMAVIIYWITSAGYSVLQNLLFKSSAVRWLLRLDTAETISMNKNLE